MEFSIVMLLASFRDIGIRGQYGRPIRPIMTNLVSNAQLKLCCLENSKDCEVKTLMEEKKVERGWRLRLFTFGRPVVDEFIFSKKAGIFLFLPVRQLKPGELIEDNEARQQKDQLLFEGLEAERSIITKWISGPDLVPYRWSKQIIGEEEISLIIPKPPLMRKNNPNNGSLQPKLLTEEDSR